MRFGKVARSRAFLFGTVVLTTFGAHDVILHNVRSAPPRQKRFTPGSADDAIAESLETGDVVLFSRNPAYMRPCGALASIATKSASECTFDHCGVIVMKAGTPHVLERTFSGLKLRSFEQRVLWSKAKEIVVRPAGLQPTPEQEAELKQFLATHKFMTGISTVATIGRAVGAMVGITDPPVASPSAELVAQVYQRLGILPKNVEMDGVAVADFAIPSSVPRPTPLPPQLKYKKEIWVRTS